MIRDLKIPRSAIPLWWPALAPLLLAAFLVAIQLDNYAFNRDEPDSLYTAGIYSSGPGTLAEVWSFIEETHPTQTQGWSKLLFVWGRLVGWSEPAIRALSFLACLLALACIYRAGRDLISPQVGLTASLLVSASVFFLAYGTIARAFALVLLFATLVLWSYGRLILTSRPAGAGALAVLWLGSAGLLYSHYFASLFLPALAVFHLLFVRRNRLWWRVTLALALALLVALPQLPGLLNGLAVQAADERLASGALRAAEIPGQLLYVLSNFLVRLPWPVGALVIGLLVLALVNASRRRLRAPASINVCWMLVFVTATAFLIMVATNETLRLMKSNRMRYMLPLLPPIALLLGNALSGYLRAFPRTVTALLVFWLILGPALVLNKFEAFHFHYPSTFHHLQRILQRRATASDLVVLEQSLHSWEVLYQHPDYFPLSDQPWETVLWERSKPLSRRASIHSHYVNIWLAWPAELTDVAFTPDNAPGRLLCERLDIAGYTLERHGRASTGCENDNDRLSYDMNIQLTGSRLTLRDTVLRLEAGLRSADEYLLSHYSLALHVIDPRTGQRVAQGDVGVGPGAFVPVRSDIDVSALAPGNYELHVALYDWQTGERLMARDLQIGAVSDMHVLQHFQIG